MTFVYQHDQMDCGPACLAMVASYYKKEYSLSYLRDLSFLTKEGVSLLGLTEAAQEIGLEAISVQLSLEQLKSKKNLLPSVLHWNQSHFVVLKKISKNKLTGKYSFKIADPGHGLITLNEKDFKKNWIHSSKNYGISLFLSPTEHFYTLEPPQQKTKLLWVDLVNYLRPYKKQTGLLFLILFFVSAITLSLPFLFQYLIDKGIEEKDIHLITLIILAELVLFSSTILLNFFRNKIILSVGTKIGIDIISDFLERVLQLPVRFLDTKMMGDFNQRIQDNERIQEFLTSDSLLTFFSIITLSAFMVALSIYDIQILVIYLGCTILAIVWSFFWVKKQEKLDYIRFQYQSENQEHIYEILKGASELKINQFEKYKQDQWKGLQKKLYFLGLRIQKANQMQLSGYQFINEFKNILITFLSAIAVTKGTFTLGELLAISYIIGQMNSPIDQILEFVRGFQYAKLSLIRLYDVKNHGTEENDLLQPLLLSSHQASFDKLAEEQENRTTKGIRMQNIDFRYEGPQSQHILENLNLFIPEGKITAIVGASGSGKTTIIKLLLKFYHPTQGNIFYNNQDTNNLSPKSIRENCGIVMQDGFIFSNSIKRNIAAGDTIIDEERLKKAVKIANLDHFIDSLPLKYDTKIGTSGKELSGGQRQRILIARAVYKDPHYIFFDEATSALDAQNEKIIHDNLQKFFKGKTVLVIAHRLSTVRNADQIIFLKEGKISERGKHQELVNNKSDYFNLVKNQLELGD